MYDDAAKALRTRLGKTAMRFARSALDCWSDGDWAGFYLNAGTALELAIKARLASVSVALLAPASNGWFEQMLRIVRSPDELGNSGPRTVSGREAVDRLRELEPKHLGPNFGDAVLGTIDRCNRVKHLGLDSVPDEAERLEHAGAFVNTIDLLVQIDPEDFWAERLALAEELVNEARDAAAVRVSTKRVAALRRVELLGDTIYQLAATESERIEDLDHWERLDFATMPCPVCKSPARAYGPLIDDGEAHFEDGVALGWHWFIVNVVEEFRCAVCGYEVAGREELVAAQIPETIENDVAGSEDIYEPE